MTIHSSADDFAPDTARPVANQGASNDLRRRKTQPAIPASIHE